MSAVQNNQHTGAIGALIWTTPVDLNIDYLYRGTEQKPKNIFSKGFKPLGKNLDLISHLDPWDTGGGFLDSAYISTSKSEKIASEFPRVLEKTTAYLYKINPQSNSIDIEKFLDHEVKKGRKIDLKDLARWKAEKETAIPHRIKHTDVQGAWELTGNFGEGEPRVVGDVFIPNPNYKPPLVFRVAQGLRYLGYGAIGVGATFDGFRLYQAYDESKKTGSYLPVPKEIFWISASWSGAILLGSAYGEAGAIFCAPLGPWGSLGCAAGEWIVGGVIGGTGCDQLATNVLKPVRSIDRSHRASELDAYDREFLMRRSLESSKKNNRDNFIQESAELKDQDPIFNAIDRVTTRSEALFHLYQLQHSLRFGPEFPLQETAFRTTAVLSEAIMTNNVELGSELFVDAALLDNQKLRVTRALADMGSTCSKATVLTLSRMKRYDVIKECQAKPERKADSQHQKVKM
ncbi:MAG: hypothetical protein ACHQAX_01420 [Gammaproteobacteria bacterium]